MLICRKKTTMTGQRLQRREGERGRRDERDRVAGRENSD